MGHTVLTPPPLPVHVLSASQSPPGPAVVRLVPPTTVTFGSSDGGMIQPVYPPSSPDAWNNDWPWAIICLKICSVVALVGLKHHDELNCFAALSVAMRFSTSFQL